MCHRLWIIEERTLAGLELSVECLKWTCAYVHMFVHEMHDGTDTKSASTVKWATLRSRSTLMRFLRNVLDEFFAFDDLYLVASYIR